MQYTILENDMHGGQFHSIKQKRQNRKENTITWEKTNF